LLPVGLERSGPSRTSLYGRFRTIGRAKPIGQAASSREWIQIDRAEAAEYEQDLGLFRASLEYVEAARTR
jgi:hypothetical protein